MSTVLGHLAPRWRAFLAGVVLSIGLGAVSGNVGVAYASSPLPRVTSVKPGHGPGTGGTSVRIGGANLTGATTVRFGSTDAAGFTVKSATSIIAKAPAGAGTVDVTVTTPAGTSATSTADHFAYLPAVTGVAPVSGPLGGGTAVTISGVDFTEATAVEFGSTAASSFTVSSETSITAVSPPEAIGKVHVTVTTPEGASPSSTKDTFKFTPTVTYVSPNAGPDAGGTRVTVRGTGFAVGTGATHLKFGVAQGVSVDCATTTECSVISPLGGGETTVYVTATVHDVISPKAPADRFTYQGSPPTVAVAGARASETQATLYATVNPNGTEVTECYFEYVGRGNGRYVPCDRRPGSGTSPVEVSATVRGLFPGTTYSYTIVARNADGWSEAEGTFATELELPEELTVYTYGSYVLSPTSAELVGYIEKYGPCGGCEESKQEIAECYFEYYGPHASGWVPCLQPLYDPEAYAVVTELAPNTTYHFRLVAGNLAGTSYGRYETFTTPPGPPPTVVTEEASAITQTSATLNATVNPNGEEIEACYFEWGTTTGYGELTECPSFLELSGTTNAAAVSAAITEGLRAGTTYHFRIVASSPSGTSYGEDQTFTTESTEGE